MWSAFKRGDRYALGLIFEMYYPPLHHYGLKLCGDPALTEDVLQDFFLYLYERRETLSDLHTLRAYLFTAFRRMLLRRQKTLDTRKNILDQIAANEAPVQFTIEELSMEQEGAALRLEMIADTLNKLPARQREVVYLKYYNDMSLQEIAEVMSITYQGVANTLYKAFVALRKDTGLLKIRELCLLLAAIVSGL